MIFTFSNRNDFGELIIQIGNSTLKQHFSKYGHMLVLPLCNVLPVVIQ